MEQNHGNGGPLVPMIVYIVELEVRLNTGVILSLWQGQTMSAKAFVIRHQHVNLEEHFSSVALL